MPRLNSLGDAVQGVGSGQISVNGAVPTSLAAALGAGWDWLSDTTIIGPTNLGLGAGLNIYQVIVTPDTLSLVTAGGANNIQAGGDIWVKWLAGITTNVVAVPSLPSAGPGAVDFDGTWAVCTVYQTGSGITVYDPTGTVLQQINVSLLGTIKMRDGWLTYHTASGWPIVDATTGSPLTNYVQQTNVTGLIPVGTTNPSVVEYNATTAQWSVRLATSGTGLLLPVDGQMFGVDAIQLDADTIRMAWSTGAGELPSELVILDIDTATGTTEIGTVVGSAIVFTTGPTLEGTRFNMATSPSGYPPLTQAVLRADKSGLMSDPWAAYLRNLSFGATSSARAISSASTPTPPSTFQADVFVGDLSTASGFPQARAAEDSATVEVDYSVPAVVTWHVLGGTGTRGQDGIPGQDGEDGDQWGLPGPMGPQGAAGNTGPQGTQGTGAPGGDGEDGDVWGLPGPPGPQGAAGTSGIVVQVVNTQTGASATGTTIVPADDSIPQQSEGTEFMTLAITPTDAANRLHIEVVWIGTAATAVRTIAISLFQDSTADALATGLRFIDTVSTIMTVAFAYDMVAGTTSATTFKVRAGVNISGTITFNGALGGRLYGGALASSITITEYTP